MAHIPPESIWQMGEAELLNALNGSLRTPKRRKVYFYVPSFMYYKTSYYSSSHNDFPTISITGRACALKCKHCGGRVLGAMYPATTPEGLFKLCLRLKRKGALGCLISGGCLPNGSVPIRDFVKAIRRVKHELGLTIFAHVGVIDFITAKELRDAGVDLAMMDVIGSEETVKEVYNLNVSVKDYKNSLKALRDSGIAFVPHVVVGLHYGRLVGELQALKMISEIRPSALVVIAFTPIQGTEMAAVKPPKPTDVAKVVAVAESMLPQTPIALGCMRPKGAHRVKTDILAMKAGVDAIAFPTEEVVKFAEEHGHQAVFSSFCCSQVYVDVKGGV